MPFEEQLEPVDTSTEPSSEPSTSSAAPEVIVRLRNFAVEWGLPAAMKVNGAKITKKTKAMIALFNTVPELLVNYDKNLKLDMDKSKAVVGAVIEYVADAAFWGMALRLLVAAESGAAVGAAGGPPGALIAAAAVVVLQITLEIFDADPVDAIKANIMPYVNEIMDSFRKDPAWASMNLASMNEDILFKTTNAVRGELLQSPKLFRQEFSFLDKHRHAYFQAQDEVGQVAFIKGLTENYLLPKYPTLSERLKTITWKESDFSSIVGGIDFSQSPSQPMPSEVDDLHTWAQHNLGPDFSYPVHESHEAQELQEAPMPIPEVVHDFFRVHQSLHGKASEEQEIERLGKLAQQYMGEYHLALTELKQPTMNRAVVSQHLQTAGYGLQLASQLAALTGHSETSSILSGVAQSAFGLMSAMALTGLAAGFAGVSAIVALPLSIMAFKQSKRQAKAIQAFQQALMSGLQTIMNTMIELDYWARIRHEELRQDIKFLAEEMRKWFETIAHELKVTQVSVSLLQEHIQKLETTFELFSKALLSQDFNRECNLLVNIATSDLPESSYVSAMSVIANYAGREFSKKLRSITDGTNHLLTADPLILAKSIQCYMLAREKMRRAPQGIPDANIIEKFNSHYASVQTWALGLRNNLTNYIGPIAAAVSEIERIQAHVQKIIDEKHSRIVEQRKNVIRENFSQEPLKLSKELAERSDTALHHRPFFLRDIDVPIFGWDFSSYCILEFGWPFSIQYHQSYAAALSEIQNKDINFLAQDMFHISFFNDFLAYINDKNYKSNAFIHLANYHGDELLTVTKIIYYRSFFEFFLMFVDGMKFNIEYDEFGICDPDRFIDDYKKYKGIDKFSDIQHLTTVSLSYELDFIKYELYRRHFNYINWIECLKKEKPWKPQSNCYRDQIVSQFCAAEIKSDFERFFERKAHKCDTPFGILEVDLTPAMEKLMTDSVFLQAAQGKVYDYRKRITANILDEFNEPNNQIHEALNEINKQLKLAQGRMYFTLNPGFQGNTSQALVAATELTQAFSPLSPAAIVKFLTDYTGEGDNILDYLTQCQKLLRALQQQVEALHKSFEGSQLTGFPALDFTMSTLRYRHQHALLDGTPTTPAVLAEASTSALDDTLPPTTTCHDEQCFEDFASLYEEALSDFKKSVRNNPNIPREVKVRLSDDIHNIEQKLIGCESFLSEGAYNVLIACLEADKAIFDNQLSNNGAILSITLSRIDLICQDTQQMVNPVDNHIFANGDSMSTLGSLEGYTVIYDRPRNIFAARETAGYLLTQGLVFAAKSLASNTRKVLEAIPGVGALRQLTSRSVAAVTSLTHDTQRLSAQSMEDSDTVPQSAYQDAFNATVALLYDAAVMMPEAFLAALQRYVNPIHWLGELTLQGLQNAYQQAQQMHLRLQRTLASEVEISDCRLAHSTCIQMVPAHPSPKVDGLRHLVSYHRLSGQCLFTEEALTTSSTSHTPRVVGRLSLFGPSPELCRFEDGSINVVEQSGVYADRPLEATIYTEACPFPKPREASVIDGMGLSAAQGAVAGLSRVAETYMRQQGYDASTSYYVTGFARFVLTGLIVAIAHYMEASARDEESLLANAVIMAFLSIVQMLMMMGIGTLLTSSTRYACERARDAGWTRTGHGIEALGTHVAPALPYVDCIRQHGIVNTMLCAATGRGIQAGTEFIGHHLLGRR